MQKRLTLLLLSLALLPGAVRAQLSSDDDIVDRVVAIVGDSAILQSQILEEVQRLVLTQGMEPPPPGPELDQLMGEVLDTWVSRILILQEAGRDTLITLDDILIEERVTTQIGTVTQQVGGQAALNQALARDGLNLAEYRDIIRAQIRQDQIQQMFLQLRLRDAAPLELTEDELLAAFQAARGQLDQRPKTIVFSQVVLLPTASEASKDSARAELQRLLGRVLAGEDFAEIAQAHSDDPGTAQLGGDLGWFRRGAMVLEFEDAAFAMGDGQVSPVVETEYGFHIIKIERSRIGERRGRHILIMPQVTEGDVQAMRDTATSVSVQAQAGANMRDLAVKYADPEAPDSVSYEVGSMSLPPGYEALNAASAGDVLGPIEYDAGQGSKRISVLKVNEVREAGAYTFEDLRGQLSERLLQQKQIAKILEDLRAKTHVEIRE